MANTTENHSQQRKNKLNIPVMGDTCKDILSSGDGSYNTYEVLSHDLSLGKADSRKNNEDPKANARKRWWRSGVIVSRWVIILAVMLITALVSALTGVTVHLVTISKMTNEDKPQQDHDMTVINRRLEAIEEKENSSDRRLEAIEEEGNSSDLRLEALYNVVQMQAEQTSSGRGSTYIRWGKSNCSGSGTELVYSGYAGGSHYTHTGAASSYLCLPKDPQWGRYDDTKQGSSMIYGAEYEVSRKWFPNAEYQNDVPCAVCRSPRAGVLMIPGRNGCYGNWTMEYHGYLMSGSYNHAAASDYVCLDEHPESVVGSNANLNGKLFYIVEGRCGSLPCPPYVNGRELTCVVCSK